MISENNKKYLHGLTIHHPTLQELIMRRLKHEQNERNYMNENSLSYIELQNLLACGCQFVTLQHNKLTLVDPNHKPVLNPKQYLKHQIMNLGYEPVIDPRTISIYSDATDELINEALSHTDPDDTIE